MEYISLNEEYNVLLQSYQTQINQEIAFIYMKVERQRNWGRGSCFLLKISIA